MKKKIAIIGLKGLPAFGGAARAMESVINILKDEYEFTIYSISTHTEKKGYYNGYEQIVLTGYKNKILNTFLYYIKSAVHCLIYGHYNLIHMNHATSGFIIPFLKIRYKIITTLRGVYTEERFEDKFSRFSNKMFRLFQYFTFKFSDILISVSKYEIDFCKSSSSKPVLHIPNGVHSRENLAFQNLKHADYLLFAASRIYGVKGCDIFLKSLKELRYRGKVLIIGDLNHDPDHKALLVRLARGLDVEFFGLIHEKALLMKYLDEARLFVFPSRIEGMSNMLLEAVSMKCPLICSDIKANTDILSKNEVTFFNSGDHQNLASKISWALNHKSEITSKAQRACEKLKRKYTWEIIAEQYRKIYEQMLCDY